MRRYVQVVLVILSVFSLVSLLVYRHEYNKLRYVLEVLNFFGTPGGVANGSCSTSGAFRPFFLSQPPPAWQRISNSIYVYSAFWDPDDQQHAVRAVAIGPLSDNLIFECYLWYDNQDGPVKGTFSFAAIPRKNQKMPIKNSITSKYFAKVTKNKGYTFFCSSNEASGVPSSVTFNKMNDETAQTLLPIAVIKQKRVAQNSSAVCILPKETPLSRSQYLEFIGYHNLIGVQDFFVYGGEFLHRTLSAIHGDSHSSVNVYSLQWNYPFVTDFDSMRSVAEADCLLRTKGSYGTAVALSFNQYVVPKFHSKLGDVFRDFDPDRKVAKFQLPTILFCSEYDDDPKSTSELPLIFRKSRYALPRGNLTVFVNRLSPLGNKFQKVSKEIAAVHWYTNCDLFDVKVVDRMEPKYDHSILRFNSELSNSPVLKLKTAF